METVKSHYVKKLAKGKVALTADQLWEFAQKSKLSEKLTKADVHRYLREEAPGAGNFARRDGVKHYQSFSVFKPGVYFIDYGEFHKHHAGSNGGATGFLVAVENLTNRLFVLPTRGKHTREWLNSIARFVELTRQVSTLYSDRDSVALSADFRDKIQTKYGIKWHFLKKGNKSFLAERFIGFVKTRLSQALNSGLAESNPKRWIHLVEPMVKEYNTQKIKGTSYRRQAVSRENFNHFLSQVFGSEDYDLRFSSFAVQPFQNEAWNKKIFKFELGDKVRVSRKADWTDASNRNVFKKVSMVGGFGSAVYTVSGRQLRADRTGKRYIPLYQLAEIRNCGFQFYERELVKVTPTPTPTTDNEKENDANG
jgi:hypothetical protein